MTKLNPARRHKTSEIDLEPDAWRRFERFIRAILRKRDRSIG